MQQLAVHDVVGAVTSSRHQLLPRLQNLNSNWSLAPSLPSSTSPCLTHQQAYTNIVDLEPLLFYELWVVWLQGVVDLLGHCFTSGCGDGGWPRLVCLPRCLSWRTWARTNSGRVAVSPSMWGYCAGTRRWPRRLHHLILHPRALATCCAGPASSVVLAAKSHVPSAAAVQALCLAHMAWRGSCGSMLVPMICNDVAAAGRSVPSCVLVGSIFLCGMKTWVDFSPFYPKLSRTQHVRNRVLCTHKNKTHGMK